MKNLLKTTTILMIILLTSCNQGPSLQEYFVSSQEDNSFIAVDVPTSILNTNTISLTSEEKEALESIKKVNFLALKLDQNNQEKYEQEKSVITKILSKDKYTSLMRFGKDGMNVDIKYMGDDDTIDEVIVFGSDPTKGLALVRVLGDDMKAENIAKLVKTVEKGDMDVNALKQMAELFN